MRIVIFPVIKRVPSWTSATAASSSGAAGAGAASLAAATTASGTGAADASSVVVAVAVVVVALAASAAAPPTAVVVVVGWGGRVSAGEQRWVGVAREHRRRPGSERGRHVRGAARAIHLPQSNNQCARGGGEGNEGMGGSSARSRIGRVARDWERSARGRAFALCVRVPPHPLASEREHSQVTASCLALFSPHARSDGNSTRR
jgi:hypothetical protein